MNEPAPGWYPDPAQTGTQRWWDGTRWTSHVASGGPTPSTDGFAIAALVLGIFGGSLLAIIFGFVGRGRIKRSGGLKQGSGLATAGIVLGFAWIAVIALIVVLGVTGALESENADDFAGRQRDVAVVVDRFEELSDDSRGKQLCEEVLTPKFASQIAQGNGGSCASLFKLDSGEYQVDLDVKSITVQGGTATATIDEGGEHETWRFVSPDGTWRVDSIASPE